MRRATAREEESRMGERFASTIAICASIIAAVRLARDENISRPSPRLASVVADSVTLARTILQKVLRRSSKVEILRVTAPGSPALNRIALLE